MCNQVLKSNIQTTPSENIIIIITLSKIHKKQIPTGIFTAHSSPPILHSICSTIFVAIDKFLFARVLLSTIWLGTETAQ